MKIFNVTRALVVRERVSAPVTRVVVQERVSQGIDVQFSWFAEDGLGNYIPPAHYPNAKAMVKAMCFPRMQLVSFGRCDRGWFCAIARHPSGVLVLYGVDLDRRKVVQRGVVPEKVKVMREVTVQRTVWR